MSAGAKLKAWFRGQKDASVSFLLEKALQKQLEKYGQILEFQLNSAQNSARVEVLLKGEAQPITLSVEEYTVQRDGEQVAVVVQRATASREWIALALQEFLLGRALPVPEKYAALSKLVL